MIGRNRTVVKRIKSSYKYVNWIQVTTPTSIKENEKTNLKPWCAAIPFRIFNINDGYNWTAFFATEREAAIAVDKKMIELGRKPVNILKPKL